MIADQSLSDFDTLFTKILYGTNFLCLVGYEVLGDLATVI